MVITMIQFADHSMLPLLKAIWQEAFGDDDGYTNFFYDNRFTDNNTLVWIEDTVPVAMMTLLPAKMNVEGKLYPVKYIYGVATKTEYRKRGISSALIHYANNLADKANEILILVPSNKGLFDFYKRCGYRTAFYLKELIISKTQLGKFPEFDYAIADISAEEYKTIRDDCFMKPGYISWDRKAIDYILRENRFAGGTCVKITLGEMSFILMYYKSNSILYVKETSLNEENILSVLSDIAIKAGCHTVHARLTEEFDLPLPQNAFGMLYSKAFAAPASSYLNLVLD